MKEIEKLIIACNKRDLHQADIEEGKVHNVLMQKLLENHGINHGFVGSLLNGELTLNNAVAGSIQAWISAL